MQTDVLAHEPACRPDFQPALPGIVQTGFDQFTAQAAPSNRRRDAGMRKRNDLPHWNVIEHSQMPVNRHLEAMLFRVVYDLVFYLHSVIFIPICDFVNPNRS